MLSATPVYCILSATFIPSFKIASCTYPILAAANGYRLISLNLLDQSPPYSFSRIFITCFTGIMSASERAFSMASLITGGTMDDSPVLRIYPSLSTAPLIFLKFYCKWFAFVALIAYLAIPDFPCWSGSSSERPYHNEIVNALTIFCLIASFMVPPIS